MRDRAETDPERLGTPPVLAAMVLRAVRQTPWRAWALLAIGLTTVRLVVGPAIEALFEEALAVAGLRTLTDRSVSALLVSPASVALLALVAAIAVTATLAWAGLALVLADRQLGGHRFSARATLRSVIRMLAALVTPAGLLVALHLALLAPLSGVELLSPLTGAFAPPPFVSREFVKTVPGVLLSCGTAGVLIVVVFRAGLALAYTVVSGCRPAGALRSSLRATGSGGAGFALVPTAVVVVTAALGQGVIVLAGWAVDAAPASASTADDPLLVGAARVLVAVVSIVGAQALALTLVARVRMIDGLTIAPARPARSVPSRRAAAVLGVTLVIATATATGAMATTCHDPCQGEAGAAMGGGGAHPLVIAHRGYDAGGPENTIAGLEAAARLRPDYVEVDVQQTGDGGLVASHDTNLFTLAGVDANLFELTTAEATATVVGMKGHRDHIPTLRGYAARAEQLGVDLLVELKVTGHETSDVLDRLDADLEAAGAGGDTMLHSLDPGVVEVLAERHPERRVGLTVSMMAGQLPPCDCDFYVIEQASLTPALIGEADAAGDEVYAWTVDDPAAMDALARAGVDGLVTDEPGAARRVSEALAAENGLEAGAARLELLRSG
ncbi:glycerophosphodiester phosphodiesterase family protein [Herbiconiux sp. VKM Ac-2851]|uniref:glycerophosphodiester phosphodiesterase family protein n=1 Tax=Herbiconiux sp. VKM Ac-2851 TaxID=2739025 RepID=UPI001565F3A6|nr:glycerophosphodiester phosphodiesterase family protein [Herbiconiux sp. VKM Ac-2851]NQX34924.1 glycerophosphoryl diester phosphodiesterase membrane domain-containing protein [Herbiconiux sp. VKM Ac-2851]